MVAFHALLISLAAIPTTAQPILAEITAHHIEAKGMIRREAPAESAAVAHKETASPEYAKRVRGSKPVAYFKMNDRTGDKTDGEGPACGQDGGVAFGDMCEAAGKIHGAVTLGAASLIPSNTEDKAYEFHGQADEEVVIPDNEYINTNESGYEERTVELWFKAGDLGAINRSIYEEGNGGHSGLSMYARKEGTAVGLYMYGWDRGNNEVEFGTPLVNPKPLRCTIQQGKPYYAALVLNSKNRTLTGYIRHPGSDKVVICGQIANMPALVRLRHHGHSNGNACIGGVQGDSRSTGSTVMTGDDHNFVGVIDEVAIYNQALPQAILDNHAAAAGVAAAPAAAAAGTPAAAAAAGTPATAAAAGTPAATAAAAGTPAAADAAGTPAI